MKSTAASLLVRWGLLGAGLLLGCGSGVAGPRDLADAGSAGSTAASGGSTLAGAGLGGGSSAGTGSNSGGSLPSVAGGGAGGTGNTGGSSTAQPCGPAWIAGSNYVEGNIVLFQGAYFIARHDNPGYDPTISTYFWDPYSCATSGGGGSSGAGGTGPLGNSSFDDVVTEALFNQMFPNRNGFYTYQGLVDATRKYPEFGGSGTPDQKKREIAAFLANVARETGELVYVEQIQKDVYCASSAKCPCQPGKSYYGRGPIQISWNYNYCLAGDALGYDLRAQPELVAQNPTIAWATGLWFWMTQKGAGTYTPHDAMIGDHGFGETIRSINGDVECNGGSAEGVNARASFYQNFCNILGVSPGSNLTC